MSPLTHGLNYRSACDLKNRQVEDYDMLIGLLISDRLKGSLPQGLVVCPMLCICIGQTIKSRKRQSVRPSVHPSSVCPSGVCGQECDVIYGPIFTKFGT